MNPSRGAPLYTSAILALAVELADYPMPPDPALPGEACSRICGSRVAVGIDPAKDGTIERIGARVSACAIGQAAAALFLRSARGRSEVDIAGALAAIEAWLAGGEAAPDWPGVAELESARPYTARHPAILLPWKAALAALSKRVIAD